jgi:hypothetical protein
VQVPRYGAPSLTRGMVCNLLVQLLLRLARAVTLGSKSHRTHDHILLSHLRLPQPGRPGPCIYIPQEQGGPAIPLGTGFAFVASYDSQGYGEGILTQLHKEILKFKLNYYRQLVDLYLDVGLPSGAQDQIFFYSYGIFAVGRPL